VGTVIIGSMKIISPEFNSGAKIPSKFTCDGEDINPALIISDVPKEAKNLALINDDPDAPAGTWVHWLIWNISPDTVEVKENSVPDGSIEGTTSFGGVGYGGPCPHSGEHRYVFKLYALDTMLDLPSGSNKEELLRAMEGHVVEQSELTGVYKRN